MATSFLERDPRRSVLRQVRRWYPHLAAEVDTAQYGYMRESSGARVISNKLHDIVRYGNERVPDKRMLCPTTVLTHSIRVEALALGLVKICESLPEHPQIDVVKTVEMGRNHDKEEASPIGDITKNIKDAWTIEERAAHEERVRRELIEIGKREYGLKIGTPQFIRYVAFIQEMMEKRTVEAQIVKIADLLDAVGEIMHELRMGNTNYGEILEEYKGTLSYAPMRYPIWSAIRQHPSIGLAVMPQPEQLLSLPRLMPLDFGNIGEGRTRSRNFRKKVMEGDLPQFYKTWLTTTFLRFGPQASQVLFPRWNLAPLS